MPAKNIVIGQKVTTEKAQRAKELRQEMTPAERQLWQQLRANRLDNWHFRRQQIIAGFIVDFYCHQAGLVVEVDGPIHEHQSEADVERDTILRAHSLTVLRFTNRQVMNDMKTVLREIRAVLPAPGPTPQPPPVSGGGVEPTPQPPSASEGGGNELPSPKRGGAGGGVETEGSNA
jgi:very-short-patch-repair endonuclease